MRDLVERCHELSVLGSLLDDATRGRGGVLLLDGPPGLGRSALASFAAGTARERGLTVLTSALTPVSQGLEHGVLRDWLGPLARSGAPGVAPFTGPADVLAGFLTGRGGHEVLTLSRASYGLTWALDGLAEDRALLLVVDDVQWADLESLRLLDLLSARLDRSSSALLLTRGRGSRSVAPAVVERIARRATVVEPAPLSVAGVELLRRGLGGRVGGTSAGAEEVHRRTGGVPFLVTEVLSSGEAVPPTVVHSVRERLSHLDETTRAVAHTASALGEDASFDAVADLTDLTVADLADPLEVLVEAGVLTVGRWEARPACPLLADAVLATMPPSQRSGLHGAAASYLEKQGRPLQVVASHLVHTLPDEDPTVVALLRAAGEESLRAGAPEVAAGQLLRAAGETRPESTDPALLALTASTSAMLGRREEALELWQRARDRARDPEELASLLAAVGDVQVTMGARELATASYDEAVRALSRHGHDATSAQRLALTRRREMAGVLLDGSAARPTGLVDDAYAQPREADTPTDRLLFAVAAAGSALSCADHRRTRDLALRALGEDSLLREETAEGVGFHLASCALSWADAYEENLRSLDLAVDESRRRGSVLGLATASCSRGLVYYRQGRLREAGQELRAALTLRAQGWPDLGDDAVASAVLTHLSLGNLGAAHSLEPELRRAAARREAAGAFPLMAAGVVRAGSGDHERALEDYRAAAALLGQRPDNPSVLPWREVSVWSLVALGRREEARELAEQALPLARSVGAPRSLGFALRTLARTAPRDEAVPLLREALDVLDAGHLDDARARTGIDLGQRLLDGRAAERAEGLDLVHAALSYGRATDVPPVERRARRTLLRAGEEIALTEPSGVTRLTPGERRAVELAARGETNRQIAQRLYVTVKAVEWHLSNAYRKLGVASRGELFRVLYGGPGSGEPEDSSSWEM